jgi:hypothetical protein
VGLILPDEDNHVDESAVDYVDLPYSEWMKAVLSEFLSKMEVWPAADCKNILSFE